MARTKSEANVGADQSSPATEHVTVYRPFLAKGLVISPESGIVSLVPKTAGDI